ncbi:hypothetical protein [Amphritea balenae]|uniref:Uncharacterized protein n=1 Tax=Amphritea balenae TaxID=452629 RepID=A0A3P1SNT4_9GAMM|nr:hypothetical protein [Amphritea balenae]RRC98614.1 hypothetical protein EHS89_13465 [Amphritea balenae]GGK65953.1 hypothetical protein GCM10007941_15210 [Amphritea balenae]
MERAERKTPNPLTPCSSSKNKPLTQKFHSNKSSEQVENEKTDNIKADHSLFKALPKEYHAKRTTT